MADTKPDSLTSIISSLVKDCESYRNELGTDRDKANEYHDGEMDPHVKALPGRSKLVSRDVRAHIKKVKPSLIRTLLGNDKIVEYEPVEEGDEAGAEQATDFVNYVILPESKGYEAIEDALNDALKLRNGIIRWYFDKKVTITVSQHTGLDENSVVQLVGDDSIEVLESSQTIEAAQMPDGQMALVPVYDLKIRRRDEKGRYVVEAVPPEQFLVHPDTLDLDESPLVGINVRLRRSDLIAMGYDREKIESIPAISENADKEDEEDTRRDVYSFGDNMPKALEELEYYELYARVDEDNDGIAELRRLVYAGAIKAEYLLKNEEWDEVPFADVVIERKPHQREGVSVTDDTMEGQKVKTVLLRETADNIYWQNKPQPLVKAGAVTNPDAIMNPSFGKPILLKESVADVRTALSFTQVPFVAASSFQMMEYFDREMQDATGISDASSGLAPDALQNMTAKASSMYEQAGIGQTELMVRTAARGLKRVFKGLLKLVIKHQDKPRTVRLKGKWVEFDPRQWNADMDATVNVGLGAGTRERDMMAMQAVLGLQEKLLTAYGPQAPYVSPQNISNGISKFVEAIGLPSGDMFFTKPTEEQIKQMQAMMQEQANKPDPAVVKAQAEMQMKAQKQQQDFDLEQQRLANERELKLAEIQQNADLKRYQIDQELRLKRDQNAVQALTGGGLTPVAIGGMPG